MLHPCAGEPPVGSGPTVGRTLSSMPSSSAPTLMNGDPVEATRPVREALEPNPSEMRAFSA